MDRRAGAALTASRFLRHIWCDRRHLRLEIIRIIAYNAIQNVVALLRDNELKFGLHPGKSFQASETGACR